VGNQKAAGASEITDVRKRRVPDPYARACALAVEQCRALGLDQYLVERFTRRRPAEFLVQTVQAETGAVIDSHIGSTGERGQGAERCVYTHENVSRLSCR
jgi:hypothetical protein